MPNRKTISRGAALSCAVMSGTSGWAGPNGAAASSKQRSSKQRSSKQRDVEAEVVVAEVSTDGTGTTVGPDRSSPDETTPGPDPDRGPGMTIDRIDPLTDPTTNTVTGSGPDKVPSVSGGNGWPSGPPLPDVVPGAGSKPPKPPPPGPDGIAWGVGRFVAGAGRIGSGRPDRAQEEPGPQWSGGPGGSAELCDVILTFGDMTIVGGPDHITGTDWYLVVTGSRQHVTPGDRGFLPDNDVERSLNLHPVVARRWHQTLCEAWGPTDLPASGSLSKGLLLIAPVWSPGRIRFDATGRPEPEDPTWPAGMCGRAARKVTPYFAPVPSHARGLLR